MLDRPKTTHELYGFYVETYRKRSVDAAPFRLPMPIDFLAGTGEAVVIPDASLAHSVYVAKNLLFAIASHHPADVPPAWIRVVFEAEEWPSPAREAYRLTLDLWEVIVAKRIALIDDPRADHETVRMTDERLLRLSRLPGLWDCACGSVRTSPPDRVGYPQGTRATS